MAAPLAGRSLGEFSAFSETPSVRPAPSEPASTRAGHDLSRSFGFAAGLDGTENASLASSQTIDLTPVLDAEVDNLEFAPIEHVMPLLQSYVNRNSTQLISEFPGRVEDLVRLGQALAAKFCKEYLVLRRALDDLRESTAASAREVKSEEGANAGIETSLADVLLRQPCAGSLRALVDSVQAAKKYERAAIALQAAWRQRVAQRDYDRHLESIVFEDRAAPDVQLAVGSHAAHKSFSESIKQVRDVFALLPRVALQLDRHGLDLASSFRCADPAYLSCIHATGGLQPASGLEGAEDHRLGVLRVGHLLAYLLDVHGVVLLPAEARLLLRLFMFPDRRNRRQEVVLASEDGGMAGDVLTSQAPLRPIRAPGMVTALHEAFHWDVEYTHACLVSAICYPSLPKSAASQVFASLGKSLEALAKKALEEVREALLAPDRLTKCCWGDVQPTWRRLLLDAYLKRLQEEADKLKKALTQCSREPGPVPFTEELQDSRLVCEAQMAGVRSGGIAPPIPRAVVIARLLSEELPVAPVSIYAAVSAVATICNDRQSGCARLSGPTYRFIRFPMPMPAAPALLHLTASKEEPSWSILIDDVSNRGATLRIKVKDDPDSKDSAQPKPKRQQGWQAALSLCYSAGSASGTLRVGPSQVDEQIVSLNFVPRLRRPPTLLLIESAVVGTTSAADGAGGCKLRFAALRPSTRGFVLGLRPAPAPASKKLRVWYEAVSTEPTVSLQRLQDVALIEPLPGEEAEDKAKQAAVLPELPPPQVEWGAVAADESGGEEEEREEEPGASRVNGGEDDEEEKLAAQNARVVMWLNQGHSSAVDEAALEGTPEPLPAPPSPPPPKPRIRVGPVVEQPQPPVVARAAGASRQPLTGAGTAAAPAQTASSAAASQHYADAGMPFAHAQPSPGAASQPQEDSWTPDAQVQVGAGKHHLQQTDVWTPAKPPSEADFP